MTALIYPKLAWSGIWKNKKLYIPYLLTSIGMVAMFYIVSSVSYSEGIRGIKGGDTIVEIMGFGSGVMAIFSAIFLFYSSSFLMRRRQREFGLYNILGMGKRHIGVIMLFETVFTSVISLFLGLLFGITFAKLAEAGIHHIMKTQVGYEMTISPEAILLAMPIFAVIFAFILLVNLLRVRLSNPIALLHSESAGERPPRANPLLAIGGVVLLGIAYYIALTTANPIMAMALFFIAVIMVILGTYALFISGSVFLCRVLQKNKRYYYRSDHFISVSSMAFRMKRNGAGLASICILLTMVLVMLTASFSLYSSEEDILRASYPRSILCESGFNTFKDFENDETAASFRKTAEKALEDAGCEPENGYFFRMAYMICGMIDGSFISYNDPSVNMDDYYYQSGVSNMYNLYMVPVRDYNEMYGTDYTLADDETLIYTAYKDYTDSTINIKHIGEFRVVGHIDEMLDCDRIMISAYPTIILFVNNTGENLEPLEKYMSRAYHYGFDVADGTESAAQQAIYNIELTEDDEVIYPGLSSLSTSSREFDRIDFFSMYGGIFFLGVMLSIVFMLAAVLIIYYKQISEGYEDRGRFEIMQKVGLTKEDIRRNIDSQMRTVFILPIAAAALHLAFAFPMLKRLLLMFNFKNGPLLLMTAGACVLIFAAIYLIVYKLTAGAYYRIVSSGER